MKTRILLIIILVVGFLLRLWKTWDYPPLLWDEAANGYNAYSILKTARDEYGKFLPMIFKSFGDYKPGLYVYLATPFVAILGLNELAVRLPAVILGSLTPLFLYLLVKEIFEDEKLALISAAVLAFLPWHIHFSRGGWEVNVMVFFLVLGSLMFFKWLHGYMARWLNGCLLCFLLALWTYQGAKMLLPLIILGLITFGIKKLEISKACFFEIKNSLKIKNCKLKILPLLIVLFLMGVWYLQTFSGAAKNRLKVISLFSHHRPQEEIQSLLGEDNLFAKNLHFYVFHGEWLHFLRGSITRYFNHFSPRFLAFDGDWSNPRHSAPYFGMIGHVNFILFLIGLAVFLSKKHERKEYFLLYWLLVASLPAALSRDIVQGVRALPMIVPLAVFIGYGLRFLTNSKFQAPNSKQIPIFKIKNSKPLLTIIAFLLIFDFIYWADLYSNHMVKKSPKDWLYGYKEAIKFVQDNKNSSSRIIFTDKMGQPYIFWAFYTKIDPKDYQREIRLIENQYGDVGTVSRLDGIEFRGINDDDIRTADIVVSSREEPAEGMDFGWLRVWIKNE